MRRTWLSSLLLLAPLLWLFRHALFQGHVFAFRDSAHYYFPLYQFVHECWANGLPTWNPFAGLGQPLLADPTACVLYPGKLVFCLPCSYALRFVIYVVAHLWLAGVGAYYCARSMRASVGGALLAGFAYELSGHVLFQYCNPIFCVGAAWLPWAVLCMERALTGDLALRRRNALLLAVVLSMMVLGGDPQIAYHCALVGFLRAWFLQRGQRLAGARVVLFAGVVALLLSAVQVVPTLEWTSRSDRVIRSSARSLWEWSGDSIRQRKPVNTNGLWKVPDEQDGHATRTYDFSVGPWRWAELLCPNVSGAWFPIYQRWIVSIPAEGRTWTPSLYLGLLPIALALFRFRLRRGSTTVRWLSWVTLLCIVAALGEYGVGWLWNEVCFAWQGSDYKPSALMNGFGGVYWLLNVCLPGYASLRYPAKWWTIASLGICLLAARGWTHVVSSNDSRSGRLRSMLYRYAIAAGTVLVPVLCVGVFVLLRGEVRPNEIFGPFDARGAGLGLLCALAHVFAIGYLLLMALRSKSRFAVATLVSTSVLELMFAQSGLIQTVAPSPPRIPERLFTCVYRCEPGLAYPQEWKTSSLPDRFETLQNHDEMTLLPRHHLKFGVRSLRSSVAMSPADYAALWAVACEASGRTDTLPPKLLLDLLGARHLIAPADSYDVVSEQFDPLQITTNVQIFDNDEDAQPEAWLAERWQQLPSIPDTRDSNIVFRRTQDVWSALLDSGMGIAVVESDLELPESSRVLAKEGANARTHECEMTDWRLDGTTFSANPKGDSILVIRDQYYPGWEATIRRAGEPDAVAPVLRVNRVMRGVLLEKGPCEVEFRYRPRSVFWGGVCSTISWISVLAALCRSVLRGWNGTVRVKSGN